jgi:hypothetical protein
MQQATTP